jgi:hypothetical protein
MSTNQRKQQKKLERKTSKRKEKKQLIVREKSLGLAERLATAAKCPVLHTLVTEDFWDQGMGWVLFSRTLPGGSVAVVLFLVDRLCLGVKNVIANIVNRYTYESDYWRKTTSGMKSRNVSPEFARKLIEAAVAYARGFGFPPHPDYQKAKLIFGDVDPTACTEEFEFGQDGKPFYISGPNESFQRSQQIIETLKRHSGEGKFDFLVGDGGNPAIAPIDLGENVAFDHPNREDEEEAIESQGLGQQ